MSIDHFTQMEKVSLRDKVSQALRAAIIAGEMEPGVVYSAPSLGARFGVSATPVREAMVDLARENLISIVPNKGFRVTEIAEKDLDDITQIRLLLEPPIVREVTPLIPAEDFPRLRELATKIVEGAERGDLVEYTAADQIFHLTLLGYAENTRLTQLVSDLRDHTRLFGLASLAKKGQLVDVAREHFTIVDLIESRDQDAVEAFLRGHIGQARGRWAKPED
ncbi:GntR family transcriptional regulator [Nocardia sp. CDC153]|uniref:GntR family transcriptional regulator n=1 Tax=Nocardia sp. CDC153 TaxID=3112167 RepID=UPI002DBA6075|nr:GntR family transcriptional regulator [Nocardia sp. CDC153]MEC3956366.1 GntR family transcriptional regulator [Nocardia sp. CDC153]